METDKNVQDENNGDRLMQICESCNSKTSRTLTTYLKDGTVSHSCDHCSTSSFYGVPDVTMGPYGGLQTCEHISDPKSGKPIPFSSKRTKMEAMKQAGVQQAASAERHHGYRNEKHLHPRIYG